MPRRWTPRAAMAAATCALLVAGCGGSDEENTRPRAVVIGIDGADWQAMEALGVAGDMPNLAALRAAGVSGRIDTLADLPLSPAIWTSIATGKTPDRHGISWFLVDRADGSRVPVRSSNRQVKAIWNMLADRGRCAAVVGWWATYPAENVGCGTIVSDALGYHGFGAAAGPGDDGKTYPASHFARLRTLVPPAQQVAAEFALRFFSMSPEDLAARQFTPARYTAPDPADPIHLFQLYAVTAQGYTAIAEELLAERDRDLLMVYFEQVDSLSHLFMKYAPPRLPWIDEESFERYRTIVAEWYRYQDELLGRLLARIDLEETAVFVLSDHGFKSGDRRIRSPETVDIARAHLDHEREGILVAAGPGLRRGEVTGASVLDVTPTLLHYLGLPVGQDMDGRVLTDLFEPEFSTRHPIRYVPTYEDDARPPAQVVEDPGTGEDAAWNEQALAALGYLSDGAQTKRAGQDPEAAPESSPEIHNNLGRIQLRRGEPEAAAREFTLALELDPYNADALLNLASVHRSAGRLAQAEHFVKRAIQADPGSVEALCELGALERDQGRLGESIRLYQEALRLAPPQPAVLLGLGDSLQRAARYEEAEEAFRAVLELAPDSFEATYDLGVSLLEQGRPQEAEEQFRAALLLDPQHSRAAFALNNLGHIQLQRGEQEAAIESFEQARQASPTHVESRYNLGILNLQAGELEDGIRVLEEALRLEPDHEAVNAALGTAYLHDGRNEEALRSLLLVHRLYPENWIAPLGLAVVAAQGGEVTEARELLQRAIVLGGAEAREQAGRYSALRDLLPAADPAASSQR